MEFDLQVLGHLHRTPSRRPPSILAMRPVRTRYNRAVGTADVAGEPVLHVLTHRSLVTGIAALRRSSSEMVPESR